MLFSLSFLLSPCPPSTQHPPSTPHQNNLLPPKRHQEKLDQYLIFKSECHLIPMSLSSSQESFISSVPLSEIPISGGQRARSQKHRALHLRSHTRVLALTLLSACFTILIAIIVVLSTFAIRYPTFLADLHINTIPAPSYHELPSVATDSKIWTAFQIGMESSSLSQQVTGLEPHTHMVHSHNDETRSYPLFEALSLGVRSIEADVHSFPNTGQNSTIYVGHNRVSLSSYRTLNDMYLSPLEEILDSTNVGRLDTGSLSGVFYNEPNTTLQLLIDIKSEPDHTYSLLLSYLERLWVKGYLTYFDLCRTQWVLGPITVVLAGEIPGSIYNNTPDVCSSNDTPSFTHSRVTFVDAPLNALNSTYNYQAGLSVMASASLGELLGKPNSSLARDVPYLDSIQEEIIRKYVAEVHKLGLKARIWDTPQSPAGVRIGVLKQLYELGVDWANADYLEETVRIL